MAILAVNQINENKPPCQQISFNGNNTEKENKTKTAKIAGNAITLAGAAAIGGGYINCTKRRFRLLSLCKTEFE